jgi:signal transduction histidine kinase
MTINRQILLSNIRMLLATVGSLLAAYFFSHIMITIIYRINELQDYMDIVTFRRQRWIGGFVSFVVFIGLFVIINIILSRRMTKKIIQPLEILNNGVKQIHENNLAYRIDYNEDDEFRSVCETFNLMAAQLESSTEQRLKDEANRRELLVGISHDLRTPLTAISGYLDGLESGVASTPEMREKYFNTIKNNTVGMKHIIEQLFLFSKLDMDEYPFFPRRFDIMAALSDMIEELTEEYTMRGLHIVIAEKIENIFVYADAVHLRRVIINILDNSARYKEKEAGYMEISVNVDGSFVQLRFADDGPGVNPEALPNLFNAFYRTDPARHTKGSGLGLAISAKIIERSGGTIHANNGDSGGLAVVIRLPLITGA